MKRHLYCALTFLFGAMALGAEAQDFPHHNHDTIHVDEITISSNREQTLRREAPALITIVTPRTMTTNTTRCTWTKSLYLRTENKPSGGRLRR